MQAFTKGRTAVITGGASGIGFAAAKAAAKAGMVPVVIDLPGENLERAAEALDDLAEHFLMLAANVADDGELFAAAEHVAANLPPVTFLMNNAGIGPASSTLTSTPSWNDIIDVNLWGVIHGTQAFSAGMIAHGEPAMIVNTGSKQGITTPPGNPAYNVSKAGVKAFTEALAHELRNTAGGKISAHLLIPGWVHTGLTAGGKTEKPAGAWTAEQTVEFMLQSLERGDFYILCPDNDVQRPTDEKRIMWAAGDIVENRPALSRWHPDYAEAFKAYLNKA